MNKTFYAIYNPGEKKFLSVYEDGEGNLFYSKVDFDEIIADALFHKDQAEYTIEHFPKIVKFYRFAQTDNLIEFSKNLVIVEIQVEFNNTGV